MLIFKLDKERRNIFQAYEKNSLSFSFSNIVAAPSNFITTTLITNLRVINATRVQLVSIALRCNVTIGAVLSQYVSAGVRVQSSGTPLIQKSTLFGQLDPSTFENDYNAEIVLSDKNPVQNTEDFNIFLNSNSNAFISVTIFQPGLVVGNAVDGVINLGFKEYRI
jgi:hypothetical protein